jgi:hypothetical protein
MRFSASTVANAAAWAVLLGLIGVAFVMVVVLGPFGLILLTLFICTSIDLREDTPTWGIEVFKARMARQGSPEQRAAVQWEKGAHCGPIAVLSLGWGGAGCRRYCWICMAAIGLANLRYLVIHAAEAGSLCATRNPNGRTSP